MRSGFRDTRAVHSDASAEKIFGDLRDLLPRNAGGDIAAGEKGFFADLGNVIGKKNRGERVTFLKGALSDRFQRIGEMEFLQRITIAESTITDACQSRRQIYLVERFTILKGAVTDISDIFGDVDIGQLSAIAERPFGYGDDTVTERNILQGKTIFKQSFADRRQRIG